MASRRSRVYIPAVLALVVAVIGGYAWASSNSGEDTDEVVTETKANCPPIARADAAFTLPAEPVVIDILANDSDADGDPLLFDVVRVSEGTTGVDDGGTPTDARDDKLIYTPADAALPTATITYRVEDPAGASSTADVTVAITDAGALPEGVSSAAADTGTDADIPAECDTAPDADDETTTTGLSTSTTEGDSAGETATTLGRSSSAARRTTGPRSTTTTTIRRTTTTSGRGNVSPAPTDPSGPAPTEPRQTTTTRPRNSSTSEPPCDDPQSCRDYGNSFRSTTTRP